jgi:N-acetylmuramoyl-L-alanine amidase
MSMKTKHRVVPGDCIASIAFAYGHFPDTVWQDADNADLRSKRDSPHHLVPGDIVTVPELTRQTMSCATGAAHRFKRKGVPEKLSLAFKDDQGAPRKGVKYALEVNGKISKGTTDGGGALVEWIPPGARYAKLTLADNEVYDLRLGHLMPASEPSGARDRLVNLGLLGSAAPPGESAEMRVALAAFQAQHQLPGTGQLDQATVTKLAEAHGS